MGGISKKIVIAKEVEIFYTRFFIPWNTTNFAQ